MRTRSRSGCGVLLLGMLCTLQTHLRCTAGFWVQSRDREGGGGGVGGPKSGLLILRLVLIEGICLAKSPRWRPS